MKHPAAYLRRSYVDAESPGDISLDAQRAAVRKLAAADGHNGELVEYNDWGVSADVAKSGKRIEYTRLLADMEAGNVQAVYAFDVDRLYRDPRDLIRLQDAAQAHDVRIVTTGGPLAIGDGADPAAETFAFIGSVFGRLELQKARKRNRAAQDARLARGDRMGHAPLGYLHVKNGNGVVERIPDPSKPLEPVLAAVREAGTILGAVRLLNKRQIKSPRGKDWGTSALTRIVEANAPGLLPRRGASGKRIRATAIFSQLVRCHCGHVMTPNTHRRQLYCSRGHALADHGRYVVTESKLLPWAKAEAARFSPPASIDVGDTAPERAALEEQRERIIDSYVSGGNKASRDRRLADLAEEEAKLDDQAQAVTVPRAIDWTWQAGDINTVLRAYWTAIELDTEMQPVRADWRIPAEWLT